MRSIATVSGFLAVMYTVNVGQSPIHSRRRRDRRCSEAALRARLRHPKHSHATLSGCERPQRSRSPAATFGRAAAHVGAGDLDPGIGSPPRIRLARKRCSVCRTSRRPKNVTRFGRVRPDVLVLLWTREHEIAEGVAAIQHSLPTGRWSVRPGCTTAGSTMAASSPSSREVSCDRRSDDADGR